jgi:hypothetical protein
MPLRHLLKLLCADYVLIFKSRQTFLWNINITLMALVVCLCIKVRTLEA